MSSEYEEGNLTRRSCLRCLSFNLNTCDVNWDSHDEFLISYLDFLVAIAEYSFTSLHMSVRCI